MTLVLSQDMDAEPCKNYELKGGLKMQKVFMTAKEVQDFLEVSRTTAYQLINEMNQELTKLGYRVQEPFIKLQSSLGIANNNINQIARRVNKTGVIYKTDIKKIKNDIAKISKEQWDIHYLLLKRTRELNK